MSEQGFRLVYFTLSGLAVLDLSQALILSSEQLENLLHRIAPVVFTSVHTFSD